MKNQLALFIIALIFTNIACSITYEASFKAMADSDDVVKKNIQLNNKDNVEVNPNRKGDNKNNNEFKKPEKPEFVSEDLKKIMETEYENDDNPAHFHNNKKFVELKTQIEAIEDKQDKMKEEDKDPAETTKLIELKEKLHNVIVDHNEKYQPEGFKNTKSLDSLNHRSERHAKLSKQNLSEEDIKVELDKEEKEMSKRVLPKRIVPSQESFDNGSMLKNVYGTYKMPKRAWYYSQQFDYWSYAYSYNKLLISKKIRLPTSMKELSMEYSFIFVVLSSKYNQSSHSTMAVSIAFDRIKLKEVAYTDASQYKNYGRWITHKYTLTAKLYNVPSGDHEFRIFARSPSNYPNYFNYAGYYSPYDKRSKIIMIGHPDQ